MVENHATGTLKQDSLKDNQLSTFSPTDNSIPSNSSSTGNSTTRSIDTYIYSVGVVAVLAMGTCVFLAYNKRSSQTVNKEQIKEQQQLIKPPKLRNMLSIQRYDGNKTLYINESFDWRKSKEDSIKDELIITATTTGTFFLR